MTEELKPTQDVPEAETKVEGQKLEWGPELGKMSWGQAKMELLNLNVVLTPGSKLWRLPTRAEAGISPLPENGLLASNFGIGIYFYEEDQKFNDEVERYVCFVRDTQ